MKTIEAVVIILAIGLAIAIIADGSLYSSNQQLSTSLGALNQRYSQLNGSFTNISNQLNSLQSLLFSLLGINSSTTTTSMTTNTSLGLSFSMSLNASVVPSGDAISVSLDEINIYDHFNNITASTNWAYTGFQSSSPCSPVLGLYNLPFTVAIVPGFYTELNLSGISSLPIFYGPYPFPLYCVFMAPPSEYDFLPLSNIAIVHLYDPINESTTTTLTFSGYYNSSTSITIGNLTEISPGTLINFSPGVYTVIGGDEWGQLVILHFEVT